MTVGELIAFINYMIMTLLALVVGSLVLPIIARAEASAERILKVMETEPDIQDKPDAVSNFIAAGPIAFEKRGLFLQPNRRRPGFARPQLYGRIWAGPSPSSGATGAAKTTLVNLIPRFYDVDAGRVTIDGRDVRDLDQTALRQQIGMVLPRIHSLFGQHSRKHRLWTARCPSSRN